MPTSRKRKTVKKPRASTGPGNPAARAAGVGVFSAGPLAGKPRPGPPAHPPGYQLPPEGQVVATVPSLYTGMLRGRPANRCVDACRTLHYAYAQLGLRSELRAVDLAVRDSAGRFVMHGTPEPSWEGSILDGHAVLYLPDVERFVDATVEQYPEIARYKIGPVCGRPALVEGTAGPGNLFPSGAHVGLQRQDLTLLYTVGGEQATRTILSHPCVQDHCHQHYRAGVNLATSALELIRSFPPPILDRIRHAPALQRVRALLDAIGDAPIDADSRGDWAITLPGAAPVRLDKVPLPPDVPPPAAEDPGLHTASPDTRRPAAARRPARPRVTTDGLTRGWAGPAGTVLRLARPGEAAAVAQLAGTTGGPLDEYMHTAIEDGTAAAALLEGLRSGNQALLMPAARAGAARDPAPLTELSLALVATLSGQVIGALYALPPGAVIAQMMEQGVSPPHALILASAAIKIKALATAPPHRGTGIASALLDGCVRLYDQLGYYLLYGSFMTGSGLEAFYTTRGFDILPAGASISLDILLARPARIGTEPSEQFFTRWRR